MPSQRLTFPESFCGECVCLWLPVEMIPAFGGLLEHWEWRATWVTDADWESGSQFAIELQEELMVQECTNQVVEAINSMKRDLLSALEMCCLTSAMDYWDDAPSTIEDMEGDPPEGFSTWGEWRQFKCDAGYYVADLAYEGISELNQQAQLAVGIGLSIISLVLAPLALPLAFATGVVGIIVDNIAEFIGQEVVDDLEDLLPDIICAIYVAPTVVSARQQIETAIDDAIGPADWQKALYKKLWPYALLNQIWEGTLDVPAAYEGSDCSACPGCLTESVFGTPEPQRTGTDTIYSEYYSPGDVHVIAVRWGPNLKVQLTWSGYTNHVNYIGWRVGGDCHNAVGNDNPEAWTYYHGTTAPTSGLTWCCGWVHIQSATACTLTYTVTDTDECACPEEYPPS